MAKVKELYRALELDDNATDAQIEEAYRRLCCNIPEGSSERQRLDYAYSVLSDMEKRARYDITGKAVSGSARKRRTHKPGRIDMIRQTLNTLFLAGAAITTVLFILQYCGAGTTPFYIACGVSLLLKLTEYLLRLIP